MLAFALAATLGIGIGVIGTLLACRQILSAPAPTLPVALATAPTLPAPSAKRNCDHFFEDCQGGQICIDCGTFKRSRPTA